MYAAGPVGSAPLCAVAAARLPREALPPLPPRFVPTPCVCAPQIAGKIRPVIEAYTLKSPCILEIPSKAHHYVTRDTHSCPEASADSASSTPRQRQIKLGTASSPGQPWSASVSFGQLRSASASLGQPRPIGRCVQPGRPYLTPALTPTTQEHPYDSEQDAIHRRTKLLLGIRE